MKLKGIAHRISAQRESLRRAVQREPAQQEPAAPKARAPKPTSDDPLQGVIGFQDLRLAHAATCALCDVTLPRGSTAHRTVRDDDRAKVLLCTACMPGPDEG